MLFAPRDSQPRYFLVVAARTGFSRYSASLRRMLARSYVKRAETSVDSYSPLQDRGEDENSE